MVKPLCPVFLLFLIVGKCQQIPVSLSVADNYSGNTADIAAPDGMNKFRVLPIAVYMLKAAVFLFVEVDLLAMEGRQNCQLHRWPGYQEAV